LAGDELVGVGDGDDLENAGKALEDGSVERPLVAGDADRGALGARDGMGLESAGLDRLRYAADLRRGRVLAHHDEHVDRPPERAPIVAKHAIICRMPLSQLFQTKSLDALIGETQ